MAHRTGYPVETPRREAKLIFAQMDGAGAANMTLDADDTELASVPVRTGAGVFTLAFKHAYPKSLALVGCSVIGTTVGLMAVMTAWAPASKTATVTFSVGGVATDPASTDNITLVFAVRNTDRKD